MVIDTLAIMAILRKEGDGPAFLQTILEVDEPRISTVTALEAAIVAGLNFGDCCVYGLAKALGEPVPCKGDVRKTDIKLVDVEG